jgi:hypothetical protein
MIGMAAGTRIWIVAGVTDLRRGFVGLSGMVQTALKADPFSGQVFVPGFWLIFGRLFRLVFCSLRITGPLPERK